jgi:hypothetical protein
MSDGARQPAGWAGGRGRGFAGGRLRSPVGRREERAIQQATASDPAPAPSVPGPSAQALAEAAASPVTIPATGLRGAAERAGVLAA